MVDYLKIKEEQMKSRLTLVEEYAGSLEEMIEEGIKEEDKGFYHIKSVKQSKELVVLKDYLEVIEGLQEGNDVGGSEKLVVLEANNNSLIEKTVELTEELERCRLDNIEKDGTIADLRTRVVQLTERIKEITKNAEEKDRELYSARLDLRNNEKEIELLNLTVKEMQSATEESIKEDTKKEEDLIDDRLIKDTDLVEDTEEVELDPIVKREKQPGIFSKLVGNRDDR